MKETVRLEELRGWAGMLARGSAWVVDGWLWLWLW